jgi:hypothetical protein
MLHKKRVHLKQALETFFEDYVGFHQIKYETKNLICM